MRLRSATRLMLRRASSPLFKGSFSLATFDIESGNPAFHEGPPDGCLLDARRALLTRVETGQIFIGPPVNPVVVIIHQRSNIFLACSIVARA